MRQDPCDSFKGIVIANKWVYIKFDIGTRKVSENHSHLQLEVWATVIAMTKKAEQYKHDRQNKRDKGRPNWLDPAIVVAFISLIGIIISTLVPSPFFSALIERIYPPTPIAPSATPIPLANITSLDVTFEDNSVESIGPGKEVNIATGATVLFKVNVITNIDPNSLIFHWDFCHRENNQVVQGVNQITYQLNENEEDCISVKIESGGEFLEKEDFFIRKK